MMATKEDRNAMTVRHALEKPCTNLLQEVLRQHVPEKDIHKLLNDPAKKRTIIPLLRLLKKEDILYPKTGVFAGSYSGFDLSLLYLLIRNVTGIPDHNKGWGNEPDITDTSVAANVERIRLLRNKYAHSSSSQLTDKKFGKEWQKIISCIQNIENTFPGKDTPFEDAANEILNAVKNQENLSEGLTKCQEDIALSLNIQQEQKTQIESLHTELKGTQEAIAFTQKKQKEHTMHVEEMHNKLTNTQGAIHNVKERIYKHETLIGNNQGNKQASMKVSGSDEFLDLLSKRHYIKLDR